MQNLHIELIFPVHLCNRHMKHIIQPLIQAESSGRHLELGITGNQLLFHVVRRFDNGNVCTGELIDRPSPRQTSQTVYHAIADLRQIVNAIENIHKMRFQTEVLT